MRYALICCAAVVAVCGAVGCNTNTLSGSADGGDDAGISGTLDVEPSQLQTITVTAGQMMPTVTYNATLNGQPVAAGWSLDRGDIGAVVTGPDVSTTFTPTGTTGGLVTVTASANGQTVQRQIQVNLTAQQNGSNPTNPGESQQVVTSVGQLTAGGGVGGVGGEGLGPAVTDAATLAALDNPVSNGKAQNLTLLYPYDQTVWPRGLLAPLLMWSWSTGDADAIKIQITSASGSISYKGTFGRPAILATTGGKFIRHPIPQDAWDMASNSAGGNDKLTVSLTIARGGMGYGPITQTWTIAPARPAGTIYYNSYGTQLVKNSIEASYMNGPQFGAAVLSIKAGDVSPSVIAGTASALGSGAGCRVCHVAASSGNKLIVQHGDNYARTSIYDLKNNNAETVLTNYDNTFGWASLLSDASLAFTNLADLAAFNPPASQLYAFPPTSATPITVTGIPNNLQAGAPAFSPNGQHIAFDFLGGTIGTTTGNGTQLVSLDYNSATNAFSNLHVLATMTGGKRAGFPSFLPTNDGVVFHYQIVNSNHRYNTWHGAQAQIWRSDLASGKAVVLSALNGLAADGVTPYLPTGGNNHGNDTTLNYEPVVAPIAAGGYAWVIFTSRRLYGNLATTDPWQSDPRSYDASQYANVTCKNLNGNFESAYIARPMPTWPTCRISSRACTA